MNQLITTVKIVAKYFYKNVANEQSCEVHPQTF